MWVSGAVTALTIHPPILRAAEMSSSEEFVARVLMLGAEGSQDREIAERLSAEGFRGPRSSHRGSAFVASIRRARGRSRCRSSSIRR